MMSMRYCSVQLVYLESELEWVHRELMSATRQLYLGLKHHQHSPTRRNRI
jgi:hypothetical protein